MLPHIFQVVQELRWRHVSVERERLTQFVYPCVIHNSKNKIVGFVFGSGQEFVVRNFCRVNGFGLRSIQISDVIWYCLVVGRLGRRGELGARALLVILLVHD